MEKGPQGPTGQTGGMGPVGLPMKDWMPPEDYAVMVSFMEGKMSLREMRKHANKVLDRITNKTKV